MSPQVAEGRFKSMYPEPPFGTRMLISPDVGSEYCSYPLAQCPSGCCLQQKRAAVPEVAPAPQKPLHPKTSPHVTERQGGPLQGGVTLQDHTALVLPVRSPWQLATAPSSVSDSPSSRPRLLLIPRVLPPDFLPTESPSLNVL